jgi:hypothetical protein
VERRPLNHVEPEAMPHSLAERKIAAARLAPDRSNDARLLAIVLRNLSSSSAYVRKEAEREVLSLAPADRQKIHDMLGRVKQSNGLSLDHFKARATALRVTGPKAPR